MAAHTITDFQSESDEWATSPGRSALRPRFRELTRRLKRPFDPRPYGGIASAEDRTKIIAFLETSGGTN